MNELDVLIEQLDELLGEGIVDADDALEVATVAGLAERLGATDSQLDDVRAWRSEAGELLDEALEILEIELLLEALDDCVGREEDQVEEAVDDFDDAIAAAVFLGAGHAVVDEVARAAQIIRQVPDPFAFLGATGHQMMALPTVQAAPERYAHWQAIAEAGVWFEGEE